jgi:glutamate racemase
MACIGVFDSGVGGLTVLAALRRALPGVDLHYVADSAYAPYGERSPDFIRKRSETMANALIAQGAELLVIACNTATAHAADSLRLAHPQLPIVGIEPGIKPAVRASRSGRIGVLATAATVSSSRFQALVDRHAEGATVVPVAASGVVAHIERGDLDSPALRQLVQGYADALRAADVDTVLLGCTHYPLIRKLWAEALGPGISLAQIEDAVAAQAERLWTGARGEGAGTIQLQSTGDAALLGRLAREVFGGEQVALGPLVSETGIEPV